MIEFYKKLEYNSDISYEGGYTQHLYVQENYSGTVSWSFPCSISGSTSITSSIVADPSTGTFPSWISVNSDYLHLNVNSPSYGTTNDYTFVVRSVILGENVDQLTTLTVYKCQVANWASWAYSSQNIWTSWSSSYIDCFKN